MSTRLSTLVLFAALALLAWTLAHWTWVFVTPQLTSGQSLPEPVSAAPVLSKLLAEKVAELPLFGGTHGQMPSERMPVATASNISVQGIYAPRGGLSGFAVLVIDGRAVAAVQGDEFAPGLVLHKVHADHVEIQRNGVIEIARMAGASLPAAGGAQASGVADQRVTVSELGPGVYELSRARLLASLRRPEQLAAMGRFGRHPRGGLVLEQSPSGGLPEQLGLRVGDVVSAIDGKALVGPNDVVAFYERLAKSESVSVDFLRADEKMNINIRVRP